eukprot:scaffold190360_cov44-Tisochrysis_lutea.AAC.3
MKSDALYDGIAELEWGGDAEGQAFVLTCSPRSSTAIANGMQRAVIPHAYMQPSNNDTTHAQHGALCVLQFIPLPIDTKTLYVLRIAVEEVYIALASCALPSIVSVLLGMNRRSLLLLHRILCRSSSTIAFHWCNWLCVRYENRMRHAPHISYNSQEPTSTKPEDRAYSSPSPGKRRLAQSQLGISPIPPRPPPAEFRSKLQHTSESANKRSSTFHKTDRN